MFRLCRGANFFAVELDHADRFGIVPGPFEGVNMSSLARTRSLAYSLALVADFNHVT